MADFPMLETDRLLLREIVDADVPMLFVIHSDAPSMQWFGTDPLAELAQAQKLVATFAGLCQMPNAGVRWGIQSKASGALIGSCGLFKWNRGWKSCIAGYELAREFWGQGFMAEALVASLAWGFEEMSLHRIKAQIHPRNTASIKLVRKLGFVQEGQLREAAFWQGRFHDMLLFALLRRQYLCPP